MERRRRPPLRGHNLVVVPHQTRAQRLRRQLLTLLVLLSIPGAGWLGWDAALRSQEAVRAERDELAVALAQTQLDLEAVSQQYRQVEVDLLVSRESLKGSQVMIHDLEQQLFRVQQDLAVYRGSLSPRAMAPGLRFQAFELQGTDEPGVFRYKVMVTRVGNEADTTQARLFIDVLGEEGGEPASVPLSSMTLAEDDGGLPLDFRYFQVVPANSQDSELSLPQGFTPKQVRLRVKHNDKLLVEQTFDWAVTAGS
ncbi:hypothetical protein SAMN05216421_2593 [Halopseudomonas xinjiangensis]|uniref:Uncharacterized protein n=1 Tax=Halopseudomonas xinjiangensis TaxID=487184 RepID=A0A1H1WKG8_9GAMM|nr:DUF6776 family protein [Halopseudomonas xinjiangensis]SDS96806.1 hypothetical protein SAMN05216421_2593 [Halopseudomonas xinjiangensis]